MSIYHAQELCRRHSFEEVAYLRWHGELPARDQISAQHRVERAQRALDPQFAAALARQPSTADPIDALRAALGALGARESAADAPATTAHAKTLRLFAVLPAIVAADQRLRQGLGVIAAREHLGYAANFLSMTFGKVPEPQIVAAFETALILYGGHILPAPAAFSRPAAPAAFSRPAAPSLSCSPAPYRAADSAIGGLQRSGEGGAGPAVIEMVNEIGIPDNARPWVEETLAAGRKIPGFNDRPDQADDARVPAMRGALGMIAGLRRGRHLIETYEALAEAVREASGRAPHLDYPASLAFQLIGFDAQAFAPILAVARLPGWTARSAPQLAVSSLIRPRSAADARAAEQVAPVL